MDQSRGSDLPDDMASKLQYPIFHVIGLELAVASCSPGDKVLKTDHGLRLCTPASASPNANEKHTLIQERKSLLAALKR